MVLDAYYSNPVAISFVRLLQAVTEETPYVPDGIAPAAAGTAKTSLEQPLLHDEGESASPQRELQDQGLLRRRRARTRWVLAYTLARNPRLHVLRKGAIRHEADIAAALIGGGGADVTI